MLTRLCPLFATLFFLSACSITGVERQPLGQASVALSAQTSDQLPGGQLDFRIAPLDTLQVDVTPRWSAGGERKAEYASEIRLELLFRDRLYRITRADQISIEMAGESDKTYDLAVLPNGSIRLPRIGRELRAQGLTPAELTAQLNREYLVLFRRPQIVVNVHKSGLEELPRISGVYTIDRDGMIVLPRLGAIRALGETSKSIASRVSELASEEFNNRVEAMVSLAAVTSKAGDLRLSPDGQQYFHGSIKVDPDGTIFVPEVGVFAASGQTVGDLTAAMNKAFSRVYQNPVDVRVSLQESANLTVFVGGEVRSPGKYPIQTSQTLMQLLSSAGWVTDSADIGKVVLLHAVGDNNYVLYRTNLAEVVDGRARLRQDLRLSPRDIVVVPKSDVAQLNVWVDQYIRRMLPFGTSFSYTISDVVHGEK